MPSSIKLKAELGDDFNVLFVHSQQATSDEVEAFIYWKKWGGSQGLWTEEAPCDSGSSGLPSFILLGNDGRVMASGHSADSKMKDMITAEIKAAKAISKDTPPALAKAVADYNKGLYANAILAAKKLAETPAAEDKNGVAPKAAALAEEWTARVAARIEKLKYLIDNAQFSRADADVLALRTSIKGLTELEAKLTEFSSKLSSDELKLPREAAKALETIMAKVNEKGVEDKTSKDLKKLSEKYNGTKPGERAAKLSRLLEKRPASI